MNVSRRSIFNYLSVLEKEGIIKRESRFRTSDGGRTSNYYSFNLHRDVNADSQQELTIEKKQEHVVCTEKKGLKDAGWNAAVAREAHNLGVAGSNPVPAISASVYGTGGSASSTPQNRSRRTERHANGTCKTTSRNTRKERKPYRIEPEAMGKPEYALKHYLIAVQQGWIDDSEHSLVMYFSAWSKCLRKQNAKKNPIRNAAAYMVSVIKGKQLNSFPSQQDEDSGVSVIKSLRSTGRLDF